MTDRNYVVSGAFYQLCKRQIVKKKKVGEALVFQELISKRFAPQERWSLISVALRRLNMRI